MTLKAALLFLATGAAIVFYFREEKARMDRQKIAEQTKGMGRPKVGGPFKLLDHNGNNYTSEDLKGKYALVSSVTRLCSERLLTTVALGVLRIHALSRYMS